MSLNDSWSIWLHFVCVSFNIIFVVCVNHEYIANYIIHLLNNSFLTVLQWTTAISFGCGCRTLMMIRFRRYLDNDDHRLVCFFVGKMFVFVDYVRGSYDIRTETAGASGFGGQRLVVAVETLRTGWTAINYLRWIKKKYCFNGSLKESKTWYGFINMHHIRFFGIIFRHIKMCFCINLMCTYYSLWVKMYSLQIAKSAII